VDSSAEEEDQESWTLYGYGYNDPVKNVDPDGNFPIIGTAIGAAAGTLIGGGIEAASQIYHSGKVTNWRAVGGSALQGGITGAAAGSTGGLSLLASAGANAGANIIGGAANRAIQGKGMTIGQWYKKCSDWNCRPN
jgi:hypothetical protein